MLFAYSHWVGTKLFSRKPPRIVLAGGVKIGEWLSFSEYWGFQNIIPEPERLFVERYLSKKVAGRGGTAFDIGANVGAFTCLMAAMGASKVHSFEPVPETFCRLRSNVKNNELLDRCYLNCMAVGRGRDLVEFNIQENSPATNRMIMPGEKPLHKTSSTQIVASIDLDSYCQSQGIEFIDFLKLDVEGMEPYVMQGATTLFKQRKIAAVLIEICPGNLRSVGLSPANLYHEFETAQYYPYALNDDGQPGVKLSLAEIEAMSLANVVLLPNA